MKSTVGPDGLCPQLLVFGVLSSAPALTPKEFPTQKKRFRALLAAQSEYEILVSRKLVHHGLRTTPPPASDPSYILGYFAYFYREKIKQYTEPHLIASVNGKQVRLHVGEITGPRDVNTAQLRPALHTRLPSNTRC